ncbi:MAG: alpha/beta fold hydrolase [Flavobacteriaceae bacterium]|nr:alpha/beta fold hydrolase [Flavobacteriaceae bacterium]
MKYIVKLVEVYLNILSVIAPKYGGKVAFNTFQKVRLKTFKNKEFKFYKKANHFEVKLKSENLKCYETGNPKGELVFLIHGWNSNAGSLSKINKALVNANYRVITFDLPGHAGNKEKKSNLFVCKEAFKALIHQINPKEAFSVVSHSFGSVVSAFALAETDCKVKNIITLSSNNKIEDVFLFFKKTLNLNPIIYREFKLIVEKYMKENVSDMITSDRIKQIEFRNLVLIHDRFDKVIPFSESERIHEQISDSVLIPFEKVGHYRMLWNEEIVKTIVDSMKD